MPPYSELLKDLDLSKEYRIDGNNIVDTSGNVVISDIPSSAIDSILDDFGSLTGIDNTGLTITTTTGTGITGIEQMVVKAPLVTNDNFTSGYVSIRDDSVSKEEYETEIKKRDDKIKDLEDKLESLTKQVASILEGNKDVIDDNVTTEQLKRMFD